MKVLILNGSPHEKGTTYRALAEVSKRLNENGIESEIVCIGNKQLSGCVACGSCSKTGKCVKNDLVNELVEKLKNSDGLVVGTPVYFASMNGTLKSVLDRLFMFKENFRNKPACAIAVARRAGTVFAIDEINKYFSISEMPIVSSKYWNMVYGANANDAEFDEEGLQTMRVLADNMSWLIKCINAGRQVGIENPKTENYIKTNFIKK